MKMMFWILEVSFFVACIVAFLLLLAHKVGLVETLQVHGSKLISELAHCDFCMSFWLSVFIMLAVVFITGDWWLAVVPLISTPIARRLI